MTLGAHLEYARMLVLLVFVALQISPVVPKLVPSTFRLFS